jgi:DNA-binding IclR family transcriptional regulator
VSDPATTLEQWIIGYLSTAYAAKSPQIALDLDMPIKTVRLALAELSRKGTVCRSNRGTYRLPREGE